MEVNLPINKFFKTIHSFFAGLLEHPAKIVAKRKPVTAKQSLLYREKGDNS
jgi:hypothetical protein